MKSPLPFFQTVEFTDRSSQVKPFCAEVDSASFCTMISCDYLATHLLNEPVDQVSESPCTYDHRPVLAIQGMVKLKASIADRAVEVVVYVVGHPCKSLIGWDLIDGLGLSIQGRGYMTGLGPTGPTGPQLLLWGPHLTLVLHQVASGATARGHPFQTSAFQNHPFPVPCLSFLSGLHPMPFRHWRVRGWRVIMEWLTMTHGLPTALHGSLSLH